jgi:hypothetical protein
MTFGLFPPRLPLSVNSSGEVCDQKISKVFVSHLEESIAGHVGVNGVY